MWPHAATAKLVSINERVQWGETLAGEPTLAVMGLSPSSTLRTAAHYSRVRDLGCKLEFSKWEIPRPA